MWTCRASCLGALERLYLEAGYSLASRSEDGTLIQAATLSPSTTPAFTAQLGPHRNLLSPHYHNSQLRGHSHTQALVLHTRNWP